MSLIVPDSTDRAPLDKTLGCIPDDQTLQLFASEIARCLTGDRRAIVDLPRPLYRAFSRFGTLRAVAWSEGKPFAADPIRIHSLIRNALDATRQLSRLAQVSRIESIDFCWALRPFRTRVAPSDLTWEDVNSGCAAAVIGAPDDWAMVCPLDLAVVRCSEEPPVNLGASVERTRERPQHARIGPTLQIRVTFDEYRGPSAQICVRSTRILDGPTFVNSNSSASYKACFGRLPYWMLTGDAVGRRNQFERELANRQGGLQGIEFVRALSRRCVWSSSDDHKWSMSALETAVRSAIEINDVFDAAMFLRGFIAISSRVMGPRAELKDDVGDCWKTLALDAIETRNSRTAAVLLATLADADVRAEKLTEVRELIILLLSEQEVAPERIDLHGSWAGGLLDDGAEVVNITSMAARGLLGTRRAAQEDSSLPSRAIEQSLLFALRFLASSIQDETTRCSVNVQKRYLFEAVDTVILLESSVSRPFPESTRKSLTGLSLDALKFDFGFSKYECLEKSVDWLPDPVDERDHRLMHFKLIASNIDVSAIVAEIEEQEQYWQLDTSRQTKTNEQSESETIFLRSGSPVPGVSLGDVHGVRYTTSTAAFPVAAEFAQRFADSVNADLGRMLIVRLRPKGMVNEHYDSGENVSFWTRYHLVLKSDGSQMRACNERPTYYPGDLFWFNNEALHEAFNDSEDWRVHMMFDLKPRSLQLPPGTRELIPENHGIELPQPALG